jgi:aminopeptidase-like protein
MSANYIAFRTDASSQIGTMDGLFDRLWPICRSITGPGISQSLEIMQDYIPINIKEVPTGTEVLIGLCHKNGP